MVEAAPITLAPGSSAATPTGRRLALFVLTAVGALNFVDRQVMSVLVEPIRAELHLSDTEFGLLTGLSFALFYAAVGIPAAALADRTNRVRLVAVACALWSVFSGACGLATGFWSLALARFGVGVGEAGGTAPSLSILADYYPPEKRAAVIGLFTVNGPLGVFLGTTGGALAAQAFGWRCAFFVTALLGVVAAPLLLLLVREPMRGAMDRGAPGQAAPVPLGVAARAFVGRPALAWLLAASGLAAFTSYGLLNWAPAYLMRVQHMPLASVGQWFGPLAGLCFGLGIWGGGALVNASAARGLQAYARVPLVSMLLSAVGLAVALSVPGWPGALAALCLPMVAVTIYVAPALALAQLLMPVGARATATAVLLLAFNIVGLGLGPLVVGALSDGLKRAGTADPLRWALSALVPAALISAALYTRVGRALRREEAA